MDAVTDQTIKDRIIVLRDTTFGGLNTAEMSGYEKKVLFLLAEILLELRGQREG
jgi:hypothetical protein